MRLIGCSFSGIVFAATAVGVLAMGAGAPAAAPQQQSAPPAQQNAAPPPSSATAPSAAAPAAKPAFQLDGFRSARFGMTEQEVRTAIQKDFQIKSDTVTVMEHPTDRTQVLSVVVPDLLPQSGQAIVSYILGYTSKTLIQVNVVWAAARDERITPETLATTAAQLTKYFLSAGYDPRTVTVNQATQDGKVIKFQGSDPAGRTTMLLLSGAVQETDGKRTLTPDMLSLFYSLNPRKPDTYKVVPGQF